MYKAPLLLSATMPLVAFLLAGCAQNMTRAAAVGADAGALTNNAFVGLLVFIIVAVFAAIGKSR